MLILIDVGYQTILLRHILLSIPHRHLIPCWMREVSLSSSVVWAEKAHPLPLRRISDRANHAGSKRSFLCLFFCCLAGGQFSKVKHDQSPSRNCLREFRGQGMVTKKPVGPSSHTPNGYRLQRTDFVSSCRRGRYSMSMRTLLELHNYLKDAYGDGYITDCVICMAVSC